MRWALLLALASCLQSSDDRDLVDIKREDLVISVEVTGELAALDSTPVQTPSIPNVGDSFALVELVPEGNEVAEGDRIAVLDGAVLDRNLEILDAALKAENARIAQFREQAAASRRREQLDLLTRESQHARAAAQLRAPRELVASIDMRGRELDEEQATMALQQAHTDAAESQRNDAAVLQNLTEDREDTFRRIDAMTKAHERMTILSPRAGTVVYVERREKLKIGDSVSDVFVHVVGLGAMIGNGTVDEVDIAQLAVHQAVALRVDALPDLQLRGTVAAIAATVRNARTDASKVVGVTIAVEPMKSVPLRPGMRFRGQIEIARIPEIVQIPADAVFVTPDGPVAYRDGEPVHLELGRRSSDAIEVRAGLVAGDRVAREAP